MLLKSLDHKYHKKQAKKIIKKETLLVKNDIGLVTGSFQHSHRWSKQTGKVTLYQHLFCQSNAFFKDLSLSRIFTGCFAPLGPEKQKSIFQWKFPIFLESSKSKKITGGFFTNESPQFGTSVFLISWTYFVSW